LHGHTKKWQGAEHPKKIQIASNGESTGRSQGGMPGDTAEFGRFEETNSNRIIAKKF
jgi:hypothetical protein